MQVKTFNCYDPNAKEKINPFNIIKEHLKQSDLIFKHLKEFRPEIIKDYFTNFYKRLSKVISVFHIESTIFTTNTIKRNLIILPEFPDIIEIIIQFICKSLELPIDYHQGEIDILFFNQRKTRERLSYFRVKSLEDTLGLEESTILYKRIVPYLVQQMKIKVKDITLKAFCEGMVNRWCEMGLGDFTRGIIDDYQHLYRFDRCMVYEVLKDFDDPNIAYLCSCYFADHPEFNKGRTIHLRRTQTLHNGDFCDDFSWDHDIYPHVAQPPLEFSKKLGFG
ncbi:MAG: hypothetical protein ACXAC7_23710 [Candidatus Hodarchaeales archaeon]|jgi:hypothetical protein